MIVSSKYFPILMIFRSEVLCIARNGLWSNFKLVLFFYNIYYLYNCLIINSSFDWLCMYVKFKILHSWLLILLCWEIKKIQRKPSSISNCILGLFFCNFKLYRAIFCSFPYTFRTAAQCCESIYNLDLTQKNWKCIVLCSGGARSSKNLYAIQRSNFCVVYPAQITEEHYAVKRIAINCYIPPEHFKPNITYIQVCCVNSTLHCIVQQLVLDVHGKQKIAPYSIAREHNYYM